jgi:hypothetical protein
LVDVLVGFVGNFNQTDSQENIAPTVRRFILMPSNWETRGKLEGAGLVVMIVYFSLLVLIMAGFRWVHTLCETVARGTPPDPSENYFCPQCLQKKATQGN